MTALEICFWMCTLCVLYVYFFYPLLIGLIAYLRPSPVRPVGRFTGSISVLLAVHNEESLIDRRLNELIKLLAAYAGESEIIVVSDGSTDSTVTIAERYTTGHVRVLALPVNVGKAKALTAGCAAARGDIIVFADARQRWAPDALNNLLKNFTDPRVGGVSGDLRVETVSDLMAAVGWYWHYEKWLRRTESLVHSTVGVTGAISAVRRQLFRSIPKGIILDDVYWPLQVAMQGYRVIHDEKALAFDTLPARTGDEFSRKLRTLSGNFQLLTHVPAALLPWRNPIWLQFLSHKIMRLVAPWALLIMLIVSAMLSAPCFQVAFVGQVVFYCLGLIGILQGDYAQTRLTSAAGSFLVLNAAAWLAFWVWVRKKTESSWKKVEYH